MTEFERLIAHLENLQKNKVQSATFDVNWLLAAVQSRPAPMPLPRSLPPVVVDGGGFGDG